MGPTALGTCGWIAAQTRRGPHHRPAASSSGISKSAHPTELRSYPQTLLHPLGSTPCSQGLQPRLYPLFNLAFCREKLATLTSAYAPALPSHQRLCPLFGVYFYAKCPRGYFQDVSSGFTRLVRPSPQCPRRAYLTTLWCCMDAVLLLPVLRAVRCVIALLRPSLWLEDSRPLGVLAALLAVPGQPRAPGWSP